jgi:monoamine oxidase
MKRPHSMTRRELIRNAALAAPILAGLPGLAWGEEPKPTPPADSRGPLQVIVVGAGLAGLAAAYELVALGHAVTVLEAGERPGGRVYTLREPFADGLFAEGGAIDFSSSYRNMMRYLKLFDLPVVPYTHGALDSVYHLRGKRLVFKVASRKEPDWPYQLTPEEKSLGLNQVFGKYFAPADAIGDPTLPGFKLAAWKSFDGVTLTQFLKNQGASNEAIELLGQVMGFGYGWSEVSALHRLLSDVGLFLVDPAQSSHILVGGNDRLPQAFAKALGDRLNYGVPVVKIVQEPDRVRAVWKRGGREESLAADRLIVTAPVPALRRIAFGPALPEAKRRIIEKLEYLAVTRTYLQVDRPFWRDAGESGDANTDLPIRRVFEYPLIQSPTQRGGILESHVRGPEGERLAHVDLPARLRLCRDNLEKVFPGFKDHYHGVGTSVAWSTNPWAGGGYAWWKPGQLTEWMPKLAEPTGRLHFAGEHTSAIGRTMEGALESGNRAAREVHGAPRPTSAKAG